MEANLRDDVKQAGPFLASHLEQLFRTYHKADWLRSDPVQFAHRYKNPQDQELVGFIAALFAYGSVQQIHLALEKILAPFGDSPTQSILRYDGSNLWPGFYYRFHRAEHVQILVLILKRTLSEFGSIEGLFTAELKSHEQSQVMAWQRTEDALNLGVGRILGYLSEIETELGKHAKTFHRGMRFLFNSPQTGSGCKRLLMYFRWMVRKDDVDLGLWRSLTPAELVFPLDTHTARLSHYLRLRSSPENRAPNWKMACEVTASVAKFCPEDPVRYDFALARLGILDLCTRRYEKSICTRCDLAPSCRYARL